MNGILAEDLNDILQDEMFNSEILLTNLGVDYNLKGLYIDRAELLQYEDGQRKYIGNFKHLTLSLLDLDFLEDAPKTLRGKVITITNNNKTFQLKCAAAYPNWNTQSISLKLEEII